jgi:colicin import membrane protein
MNFRATLHEFRMVAQAFTLAIGVHLLMAALVVLGTIDWKPFKPRVITGMTIEAVMVDTSALLEQRREAEAAQQRAELQQQREQELAAQRERDRLRQAEEEKQRLQEQAAQKRQEDMRLQRLRQQQERDRIEREQRQQQELDEIRRQRAVAERERKIEEERLKQLDALKQRQDETHRKAEQEAERLRQLDLQRAEFRAGQLASLSDQYYLAIQQQVTQNWLRPSTARPGLRCTLHVVQIPGGEVISASIAGACNADEATRRSLVGAVERAGSLPYRGFEEVFDREIDFVFTYDGD